MPIAGVLIILFALENIVEIIRTPAEKLGAQTKSEG
jgi:TRAP-type C4-dicarboxylate transport system permease small subunit